MGVVAHGGAAGTARRAFSGPGSHSFHRPV